MSLTPRNIGIALAAVGGAIYMFPRTASKASPMENVFETQGVKNVGSRYAAQGGSNTHLPGVATPLGNSENTISNQENAKGISTGHFEKNHADQKVGTTEGSTQFLKAQYGNEKGK